MSAHSFACKCEIGDLSVPWWQMLISSSLKQKCKEGFWFLRTFLVRCDENSAPDAADVPELDQEEKSSAVVFSNAERTAWL